MGLNNIKNNTSFVSQQNESDINLNLSMVNRFNEKCGIERNSGVAQRRLAESEFRKRINAKINEEIIFPDCLKNQSKIDCMDSQVRNLNHRINRKFKETIQVIKRLGNTTPCFLSLARNSDIDDYKTNEFSHSTSKRIMFKRDNCVKFVSKNGKAN